MTFGSRFAPLAVLLTILLVPLQRVRAIAPLCGNSAVEGDEECDDGNIIGGDGCAANCTQEDRRVCEFSPVATGVHVFIGGTVATFAFSGRQTITTGRVRASDPSGQIPLVIKASDIAYQPSRSPGVQCQCIRGVVNPDFGPGNAATGTISCGPGGLAYDDLLFAIDHNTHFNMPDTDPTCINGTIESGLAPHVHAGACNGQRDVT